MKRFAVVAILMTLCDGVAAAQSTSLRDAPTVWTASQQAPQLSDGSKITVLTMEPLAAAIVVNPPDKCYFIRSYLFEQNDGEPPVFKKETLCTKSSGNAVQYTKRRRAGLKPL